MARLVITADVDEAKPPHEVYVRAIVEVELAHGVRVVLLNDRGWGSSATWSQVTAEEVRETTLVVVGPDEPFDGQTREDMSRDHWAALQRNAQRHGVHLSAEDLPQLPLDFALSDRLLARLAPA